jgi:hypothetical protein
VNFCVPVKNAQQMPASYERLCSMSSCCFRSITWTESTLIMSVQRWRSIGGTLNAAQGSLDSKATTLAFGELVFTAASSGEARLPDMLPFTRQQNEPLRLLHMQAVRPILTS